MKDALKILNPTCFHSKKESKCGKRKQQQSTSDLWPKHQTWEISLKIPGLMLKHQKWQHWQRVCVFTVLQRWAQIRTRDEWSHIFQTLLMLLALRLLLQLRKILKQNSESCLHSKNFQVAPIKKIMSIRQNICHGYFAFDRPQMVGVVMWQA